MNDVIKHRSVQSRTGEELKWFYEKKKGAPHRDETWLESEG